jgi:hypothetical protein
VTVTFAWENIGSGTQPYCRVLHGGDTTLREGRLQVYRNGVGLAAECGAGATLTLCPDAGQCLPCTGPGCAPASQACCDPGPPGAPGGNTWTVEVTEFSEYAVAGVEEAVAVPALTGPGWWLLAGLLGLGLAAAARRHRASSSRRHARAAYGRGTKPAAR